MSIAALVAKAPLRRGSKGDAVKALQLALRAHGHELMADGAFGAITDAAVRSFQAAHGLTVDGVVGKLTAGRLDAIKVAPADAPRASSLALAPHLSVMRAITGTKEFPGAANNPVILSWVTEIVAAYPELKSGVGWYKADATAWCGLAAAYCVAAANYKPPLAPLWALNWRSAWSNGVKLQGPCLGAIGVMSRDGGGHVTFYEGEDASGWFGRGGNQSDMVNVARFPHSRPVTWMWPKALQIPNTGRLKTSFNAALSVREA